MQNEGQITNICNECVHCYMGLFMHMHGSNMLSSVGVSARSVEHITWSLNI